MLSCPRSRQTQLDERERHIVFIVLLVSWYPPRMFWFSSRFVRESLLWCSRRTYIHSINSKVRRRMPRHTFDQQDWTSVFPLSSYWSLYRLTSIVEFHVSVLRFVPWIFSTTSECRSSSFAIALTSRERENHSFFLALMDDSTYFLRFFFTWCWTHSVCSFASNLECRQKDPFKLEIGHRDVSLCPSVVCFAFMLFCCDVQD